jgi:hypothetical protein
MRAQLSASPYEQELLHILLGHPKASTPFDINRPEFSIFHLILLFKSTFIGEKRLISKLNQFITNYFNDELRELSNKDSFQRQRLSLVKASSDDNALYFNHEGLSTHKQQEKYSIATWLYLFCFDASHVTKIPVVTQESMVEINYCIDSLLLLLQPNEKSTVGSSNVHTALSYYSLKDRLENLTYFNKIYQKIIKLKSLFKQLKRFIKKSFLSENSTYVFKSDLVKVMCETISDIIPHFSHYNTHCKDKEEEEMFNDIVKYYSYLYVTNPARFELYNNYRPLNTPTESNDSTLHQTGLFSAKFKSEVALWKRISTEEDLKQPDYMPTDIADIIENRLNHYLDRCITYYHGRIQEHTDIHQSLEQNIQQVLSKYSFLNHQVIQLKKDGVNKLLEKIPSDKTHLTYRLTKYWSKTHNTEFNLTNTNQKLTKSDEIDVNKKSGQSSVNSTCTA